MSPVCGIRIVENASRAVEANGIWSVLGMARALSQPRLCSTPLWWWSYSA